MAKYQFEKILIEEGMFYYVSSKVVEAISLNDAIKKFSQAQCRGRNIRHWG